MAGIAVFPTPASSPVSRRTKWWPSPPCTHRPVACPFDYSTPLLCTHTYVYCPSPCRTPQSALPCPFPILNQISLNPFTTQTQTKRSASTGILHSHIQTRARHSPGNLLGAGRNHFFICLPSPPISSTTPDCLPSAGTCQEHRASVAISGPSRYIERVAKPQCWTA